MDGTPLFGAGRRRRREQQLAVEEVEAQAIVGQQRRADLTGQARVFRLDEAGGQVFPQVAGEGERPEFRAQDAVGVELLGPCRASTF
jgi:hypothetical protein